MNIFYVYLHRRLSDNRVFYVGKGKGNRAYVKTKRNSHWNHVVNKHGLKVEIVFDNLTEEDSFQIEKDTILEMRYFGYPLVNMTDGGEGSSGFKHSEESITKRALKAVGVPLTEQHRDNIRKSQIGVAKNPASVERMRQSLIGKKQSESTKQKRIETLKTVGTCNDRNTYCFFSKDDIFVGTRKELSEHTNLPSRKFTPLFGSKRVKMAHGWYVLDFQKLMILKELIK